MADKIISATLKVETGSAAKDIGEVNNALDDTSKSLDQTNTGVKETQGSFANLKNGLNALPGSLGQASQGVGGLNQAFKALLANPIVLVIAAIVAAIAALVRSFLGMESVAEKIEQVMAGLSAAFVVWRDRVLQVIGAIGKFLSGDFTGAFEDAEKAVTGFGDAMVEAFNRAADATKALQEAQDDLTRNISVNRAKLDRDLARSRELISDETASYEERKKAVDEVRIAQQKQATDELNNAKKTLLAKYQLALADKNNADALDEYRKAQADFYSIQQQQAADARAINKQANQIEQDQRQKNDAAAKASSEARKKQLDEEARLLKEATDKQIAYNKSIGEYFIEGVKFRQEQRKEDADNQKKQDKEDQDYRDQYLEDTTNAEIAAMDKVIGGAKKQRDDEKKINDQRIANQNAYIDSSVAAAGALSDLFGRQTAVGKAFAVAQAVISTYTAAAKTLAAFSGVPIPGYAFVQVAATIAAGLAQVKSILAVQVPGQASGGGSVPAPQSLTAPAAPIAPIQRGTSIDNESIEGIGNATFGRVYVLESDVARDTNRRERLNRASILGG